MKLEQSLVLNRYLHNLLGVRGLEEIKPLLARTEEGATADGHSRFFNVLASQHGLRLPQNKLDEYDKRIMHYETSLAASRGQFAFKYFQYLVS